MYMRKTVKVFLIVPLALAVAAAAAGAAGGLALELVRAEYDRQPIPILTQADPALTVAGAYAVQKEYVAMKLAGGEAIAGFKGGLTAGGVQKRFGMDAPVTGVLFLSGLLTGSPVLDRSQFGSLMLETEIAFVIGEPIAATLPDIASLRGKVRAAMPAIEAPDLGFADMKKLKAADLIAANVSARQFIGGPESAPDDFDLNAVRVVLYRDGAAVSAGSGEDALGDQWNTALWLVNSTVEQGYKIEPGHILMTGALGAMLPGKPGRYVADYGPFGRIEFTVK